MKLTLTSLSDGPERVTYRLTAEEGESSTTVIREVLILIPGAANSDSFLHDINNNGRIKYRMKKISLYLIVETGITDLNKLFNQVTKERKSFQIIEAVI
jgi:hypothetical protein